jgi:wyosine [tRNA(Phe)-imidazoG37] synthetase (radical SAM superfamily)
MQDASLGKNQGPVPGAKAPLDTAFGRPRTYLNNRFVYEVISQRANGLSIGINLNPNQRCNFDCVYCEVKRDKPSRGRKVNVKVMAEELEQMLRMTFENRLCALPWFRNLPPHLLRLKEVALSGDGEPTLCPNFGEVLREVVRLRSSGAFPFFKIVLITNTAGLATAKVRRELRRLTMEDEIWLKLDAGTQEYMDKINRPDITLRQVMSNILLVGWERPVVIQSLFPLINGQEPPDEEIEQYAHRLQELKAAGAMIKLVQIYSAHRPPHCSCCEHLPLKTLSRIARRVREVTGLKAEVF